MIRREDLLHCNVSKTKSFNPLFFCVVFSAKSPAVAKGAVLLCCHHNNQGKVEPVPASQTTFSKRAW